MIVGKPAAAAAPAEVFRKLRREIACDGIMVVVSNISL
jgi:hypothetical protein